MWLIPCIFPLKNHDVNLSTLVCFCQWNYHLRKEAIVFFSRTMGDFSSQRKQQVRTDVLLVETSGCWFLHLGPVVLFTSVADPGPGLGAKGKLHWTWPQPWYKKQQITTNLGPAEARCWAKSRHMQSPILEEQKIITDGVLFFQSKVGSTFPDSMVKTCVCAWSVCLCVCMFVCVCVCGLSLSWFNF